MLRMRRMMVAVKLLGVARQQTANTATLMVRVAVLRRARWVCGARRKLLRC